MRNIGANEVTREHRRRIRLAMRKRTDRRGRFCGSIGAAHASNIQIDAEAQHEEVAAYSRASLGLANEQAYHAEQRRIEHDRRVITESGAPQREQQRALANLEARTASIRMAGSTAYGLTNTQPPPSQTSSRRGAIQLDGMPSRTPPKPGAHLDLETEATRLTAAYRRQHPGAKEEDAIRALQPLHPEAFAQYPKEVVAAVSHISGQSVGEIVKQFDQAVAAERKADSRIDMATAMERAAEKHPDLAKARNVALTQPITKALTLTNR